MATVTVAVAEGGPAAMVRCSLHGKNRTPSNLRETTQGSGLFQCLPGSECKTGSAPPQVYAQGGGLQGTVHKWVESKGFGFISPSGGGDDVFVHKSAFGGGSLSEGQKVNYDIDGLPQPGQKARAINVSGPAVKARDSAKQPGQPPQQQQQEEQQQQQQQQPQQQPQQQQQQQQQQLFQQQQQLVAQQPLWQQQQIPLQQQAQQQMLMNPALLQMQALGAQQALTGAPQQQTQSPASQQQTLQMACPFCQGAFVCPQRGIAVACPHCGRAVQC